MHNNDNVTDLEYEEDIIDNDNNNNNNNAVLVCLYDHEITCIKRVTN